jgi:diguanylate cyclase (GGDEF)-like protein
MSSTGSATEIAFLSIAVMQAVFAIIWAVGSIGVASARRAMGHWAAWSALSAITWIILAMRFDSLPLIGVVLGLFSAMLLHRGIRIFIEQPPMHVLSAALLMAVAAAAWIWNDPATRHWQAVINYGALSIVYLLIARDLFVHARDQLRFRWPLLLTLPVLLGSGSFVSRSVRALLWPESVYTEMIVDSQLNTTAAFVYIALVLALHAVLVSLVVGKLVNELRRLSTHDALTELLNRRAMEEALLQQTRRSQRSGEVFTVMMLDLDHFKRINDQFGHAVGDSALKHVSTLLRGALREVDRLARFGGEEFVVLMPAASLEQAEPIANRLRELLATHPLKHETTHVSLSVSIGLAEWRDTNDDTTQLLLRADAALFQAKVQGRNRVVAAKNAKLASFTVAVSSA